MIGIVWRGACMGGADIVPGVSGGTVALVLGIYNRLLSSLSHFDLAMLQLLWRRQWHQLAHHIDLRFLVLLGSGIVLGGLGIAGTVSRLLNNEDSRVYVLAVFFGMILASAILVSRMVGARYVHIFLPWTGGMLFAFYLSGLSQLHQTVTTGSLMVCGAIAICAMILPGVSGAMILVLLGVYEHLLEIPNQLLHGQQIAENLVDLVAFAIGCAVGLVLFSKLLRWLLDRHHAVTMATLCGFMFGALRKLWPFQRDLTPDEEQWKLKTFEARWPDTLDAHVMRVLVMVVVVAALVLAVDYWAQKHRSGQRS